MRRAVSVLIVFSVMGCVPSKTVVDAMKLPTGRDVLISAAREKDEEEALRTGMIADDRSNQVRIDATNDDKLRTSMAEMMENWSGAKRTEFSLALGRCIAVSGKMNETDETSYMQCVHGMTADEIFAKAALITDDEVAKSMRAFR